MTAPCDKASRREPEACSQAESERHYLAAIKTRLDQLYTEHPEDSRLREQISDEVDWIDEKLGRDVRSRG